MAIKTLAKINPQASDGIQTKHIDMGLLDLIEKAINERGSAEIMRQRHELIREQVSALEKQLVECEAKAARLENENRQLRDQVKTSAIPQEFIKHKGALFRRNNSGGYEDTVFCRQCKEPMTSLHGMLPYHCRPCNIGVDFKGNHLHMILSEIGK